MIVVPTVPHTGTHFMRDELLINVECFVRHVYRDDLDELRQLLEAGNPCIVVRRDPWAVLETWIRTGKDPRMWCGYSLPRWFEVLDELVEPFYPLYLNLDDEHIRDEQLAIINNTLGTVLTTDWPIVRQPGE